MKKPTILISVLTIISYLYIAVTPASAAVVVADTVGVTKGKEISKPEVVTDSLDMAGYTELDDFVVEIRKKLVESDGATLTYNVAEDPESSSSNILDILRKVPGVTVDGEDNVQVNGQSSFKILMNGREDAMLKGDLKNVLKSIPAASIKKIEVISEPGAKYDAEGVGGVLNIVTDKKTDLSGFLTQLSGWINSYQVGGYLNGRTKIDKVMLDATVNYNNGYVWPRKQKWIKETEYFTDPDKYLMRAESEQKMGWDYTGVNLNMSWEPDTLNLFVLSGYYNNNTWCTNQGTEHRTLFDHDMKSIWTIDREFRCPGFWRGAGGQASYQHTFGKEGHNLVLSYMFNYALGKDEEYYKLVNAVGAAEIPYSISKSSTDSYTHIGQIDYANPFSEKHLFEAGAKAYVYWSGNVSKSLYGEDEASVVEAAAQTMQVKQITDVYALYASYTGKYDKWGLKAGLRYEYSRLGLRYRTQGYTDFTTELNDIVPNAAISYNITSASNIRLAYQMRISRPGLWSLNPYVNTMTPGAISYGNEDLKSEAGHNVSIGYSNYEGKFGGSAKLSYYHVSNSINDIKFVKDGIIHTTYANVGRSENASMELNFSWDITNDFRWSLYSLTSYNYLTAKSELMSATNCGWREYLSTDLNYKLPCKIRLGGYVVYQTAWRNLQSKGQDVVYYGLSASRSFLKDDALTINFSLSNFAEAKRHQHYTQTDSTMQLRSCGVYSNWNVALSISWRFGGLKANVKKTNAVIESESESSNQGKGN